MFFDGIDLFLRPSRAAFSIWNNKIPGGNKSDDAVVADVQMAGAKYCIRPMAYTGNGSTELVYFELRFEGEESILEPPVTINKMKL